MIYGIYVCMLILLQSLWKTLFNVIKVLVKVRDKVRVRARIHSWNMYYRRSVILLNFTHNPARSIRTNHHYITPQE